MSKLLENKTAIVTGASAGIGQATAHALAQLGAAVVIHARRSERLEALARIIKGSGGRALAVPGDASRPDEIDSLLEKTLGWSEGGNKYDIVVVNAGRGLAGSLLGSDEEQWREVFQVNVMGAAHLMREAGRYLAGRGCGDIVVLGSVAGHNISPFSSFYGSSKFAVGSLAEGLRREIGPMGVRVSLIKPGVVVSEFQAVAGYTEENFGKTAAQYGALLEPEHVAEGICWILSLPPHVNVGEMVIRPTGQNYP